MGDSYQNRPAFEGDESDQHGDAPVRRRRRPGTRAFHFSLGEVLARTSTCFVRHLPMLAIFSVVVFAPVALMKLDAAEKVWTGHDEVGRVLRRFSEGYGEAGPGFFWARVDQQTGTWARLLELSLPLLLQIGITLAVFQYLRGERVEYGRSLARGLARLLPVVGFLILIGLVLFGAMIPAGLILGGLVASGSALLAFVGVLGITAVTLMVICIFFVAVQAIVVERIGPAKAMSRSSALTSGARWKIFGILMMLWIVALAVQLLLQNVIIGQSPSSLSSARVGLLVSLAVSALLAVFQAVCAAVVYHDLRHAKEGVGIEELMRVFA